MAEKEEKTKLESIRKTCKNINFSKLRDMIASREVNKTILEHLTDQEEIQL